MHKVLNSLRTAHLNHKRKLPQLILGGCGEREIVDECMTFLFAGEDTTSALLSFAAYELSRKSLSMPCPL